MHEKSQVTGFKYDQESLNVDMTDAFEKLNWRQYIKSDTKVFVKPNFAVPFFKPGVTTNTNIIEIVLGILKDRASEVYVGEADGGDESFTAEISLKNHKIPEICKKTGTEMLNLSTSNRIKVTDKINGKRTEVTIPRVLLRMDESISIPVLKVHVITKVSLSLKNLWGCHPSSLRLLDHKHLSERLALIAKSINLRFAVVDAIYGLNKHGPMHGDVVDVGAILVGDNPVATDSIASQLMGFDPQSIHHIVVASNTGLGSYKNQDIEILADLSSFQQHFSVTPSLMDWASSLCFKSYLLNKLVSDSFLTKPLYHVLGKEPRKKIIQPGDEI
jgi:uncharacterized protein (DUF362 family)